MRQIILLVSILIANFLIAGNIKSKTVESKRNTGKIVIDGTITEGEWRDATTLNQFVEFRPNPGQAEHDIHKTVAYLLYDDQGIYFGGFCHEGSKDSISTELVGRDGFGNNDFVGIIFDTYKYNTNAFEYFINPLNEQIDAKHSPNLNFDFE